jgi:hypothetical protein
MANTKNVRYTKRTHDTRMNGMKPTNNTENANERTHDTRTNESLERNHIFKSVLFKYSYYYHICDFKYLLDKNVVK